MGPPRAVVVVLCLAPMALLGAGAWFVGRDIASKRESSRLLPAALERGDAVRARVEAYREAPGRYPVRLEEAGRAPDDPHFGPWRYRPVGEGYELGVGTYGVHGIWALWQSKTASWYIDG